ncbi:MAG: flagellar biosynthetic protein FliO [Rhodospirillales bacterium]|nr:flagellar biosynthetic protein FliO [Rhodospirillales bacterium]
MPALLPSLSTAAFALAAVLALIALIAWIARRFGFAVPVRPGGPAPLALEASLALDPRRRLLLLRIADRRLLLLTGGGADLPLGWLPVPNDSDPAP